METNYFKGVKRKLTWSLSGTKNREETSWEAIQKPIVKMCKF